MTEKNIDKQTIIKYSYAVLDKEKKFKISDEWKYDDLKSALNAFLMQEKYSAVNDSKLFYAKDGELVYVGFSRDGIDDHVALFFRLKSEISSTVSDVSLEEIEELFK